jgi:16S rRNA (adenine1518-N6/adenine1519-N6)-dimethyltransferase
MYAKKTLGQHFLKSERALASIVLAGEVKGGDTILEIGPGTGALTEKLLAAGSTDRKVVGCRRARGGGRKRRRAFRFSRRKVQK